MSTASIENLTAREQLEQLREEKLRLLAQVALVTSKMTQCIARIHREESPLEATDAATLNA